MALPAKKVSLSVVVVVILLLFSVHAHARRLSPTWDDKEYDHYWKTRLNQGRPRDDREYWTYSVLLRERPDGGGEAMDNDKDARRHWYESFVPSTPTDSGEPRLVHCYSFDVNGFLAMLTWDEAMALAKKPGLVRRMTSSYREPLTCDPATCGFVTAITKRNSVRSRQAF